MDIGVISDTHDNEELTKRAAEFFEYRADKVIHCGDITLPDTAYMFAEYAFDFYAIRGNNDTQEGLAEAVEEFGEWLGEVGELRFVGTDFGIYHGTEPDKVKSMIDSGNYDYVFKGHTHQKILRNHENGTTELNPGGVSSPDNARTLTVATISMGDGEVEFYEFEKDR